MNVVYINSRLKNMLNMLTPVVKEIDTAEYETTATYFAQAHDAISQAKREANGKTTLQTKYRTFLSELDKTLSYLEKGVSK